VIFNAMIGALNVGLRRLEALFDEHGGESIEEAIPALLDYSEAWIRRDIERLPTGRTPARTARRTTVSSCGRTSCAPT
jgi:N-methylhydantoinase B